MVWRLRLEGLVRFVLSISLLKFEFVVGAYAAFVLLFEALFYFIFFLCRFFCAFSFVGITSFRYFF